MAFYFLLNWQNFQMATETTRLILILVISITYPLPIRMILVRTAESRSSLISSTEGHVLMGFVIHKQRTHDVLSCAQLCLARPNCLSFNFENTKNGVRVERRNIEWLYDHGQKHAIFKERIFVLSAGEHQREYYSYN